MEIIELVREQKNPDFHSSPVAKRLIPAFAWNPLHWHSFSCRTPGPSGLMLHVHFCWELLSLGALDLCLVIVSIVLLCFLIPICVDILQCP